MTDLLDLLILGALAVLAIVLAIRSTRSAGRQSEEAGPPSENRRCAVCGKATIYDVPMCPRCAQALREWGWTRRKHHREEVR